MASTIREQLDARHLRANGRIWHSAPAFRRRVGCDAIAPGPIFSASNRWFANCVRPSVGASLSPEIAQAIQTLGRMTCVMVEEQGEQFLALHLDDWLAMLLDTWQHTLGTLGSPNWQQVKSFLSEKLSPVFPASVRTPIHDFRPDCSYRLATQCSGGP